MKLTAGPVLAGLALVGSLGVVHGVYADRWVPSGQLRQATAAVDLFPAAFGDWVGEDVPYEPEDMARAGIKACAHRRYRNTRTRESVAVLLVCGRGGPISVHTPDVCYTGAGHKLVSDQKPVDVTDAGGGKHGFRVARFGRVGGISKSQLDVYWAWSRDGRVWEAPGNARWSLARSPALYKLYVVREFVPGSRAAATDACEEFLRRALPDVRDCLTGTGG